MTKSQKTKLRNIKIMKERKKLFGGKGFISMPHINTDDFDIVLYQNSGKKS